MVINTTNKIAAFAIVVITLSAIPKQALAQYWSVVPRYPVTRGYCTRLVPIWNPYTGWRWMPAWSPICRNGFIRRRAALFPPPPSRYWRDMYADRQIERHRVDPTKDGDLLDRLAGEPEDNDVGPDAGRGRYGRPGAESGEGPDASPGGEMGGDGAGEAGPGTGGEGLGGGGEGGAGGGGGGEGGVAGGGGDGW